MIRGEQRLWRVLVVGAGALLEQAVHSLLAHEQGIQVSELMYTYDDAFIQYAVHLQPDVIIFHETNILNPTRIFGFLNEISAAKFLRIIILRAATATVDLYEKRTAAAVWVDGLARPTNVNIDLYEKRTTNTISGRDFIDMVRRSP